MSHHDADRFSSARRLDRRAFLRGLSGALALGLLPPTRLAGLGLSGWPAQARAAALAPGDIAPEEWGPVGWYDLITAYVDCDVPPNPGDPPQFHRFRGQVVFLHYPFDLTTYVFLAGRDESGVVKGYRVFQPIGLDQPRWSTTELNISLGGGGGGAQLRYDRPTGRLTLWLNGFVIGAPEQPARRFGFLADVEVHRAAETGKSRVLAQGLGSSDDVQFYMRAGTTSAGESSTGFLMIAHLSIRGERRLPETDVLRLPFPWPFPTVTYLDNQLFVTQTTLSGALNSFVWNDLLPVPPALAAPTTVVMDVARGPDGLNYYLPMSLQVSLSEFSGVGLDADIASAPELAFTAEFPTPDRGVLRPHLCLSTTPVAGGGFQMAQTVGIGQAFLPHLRRDGL